ncbi:MAG: sulfotransferase [Sulfitobacter sp.]
MTLETNSRDTKGHGKEEHFDVEETLTRIMQHQDAGRFPEAGELLDKLLRYNPGHTKLIHYKGFNLIQQGETERGMAMIKVAMEQAPDDPVQLCDYGTFLAQSGKVKEALSYFQMATEIAPNYSVARSNLGGALVLEKKYRPAIAHLEKAIELDGNLIDAHTNLATAYMQTNQFEKAVNVLFKALAINPQSLGAHIQLSAALYRRERYEAAEHHARRAIELNPNAAEAYLHLGNALASSGKMDEAAKMLLKIVGRPPVGIPALSRLIQLRKVALESPELAILERTLQNLEDMSHEGKAAVHFAAGKAFDDLKDYVRAFQNFQAGNEINKVLHPYDHKNGTEQIERLNSLSSPELMKRCGGAGISDVSPIFICGMPRSGTTLMDQMFSRHPAVQAGGELRATMVAMQQNKKLRSALHQEIPDEQVTADDFSQLGESYVAAVRREGIHSEYLTDKMPANYRYIGLLSLALPRAKFLIMRRHPLDCLLSNYFQHFGKNQPFSSDFKYLAQVYSQFDEAATMWARLLPECVKQISYEAVTAEPEDQMRSILDFIGLEWTPDVLDHNTSLRQVNTASTSQVREPIYKHAVARWRNYANYLTPLATELQGYLTKDELAACGVPLAH